MARIVLFLAIALARTASGGIELVRDGRSAYTICLGREPSASQKRAAVELQRFVEQMSGARLPVMAEDVAPQRNRVWIRTGGPGGVEAFTLRTEGTDLLVEGGRERGAMYGVYALLEKLGCRWFTPDVATIPRRTTIVLNAMNESQQPAFEYREVLATEAADKDWAARNRINGEWNKLDDSTGGAVRFHPFVHSFAAMVPAEKYFKDHPEYFSRIDGKRRAERSQLCLTNPDVLRIAVREALAWADQQPDARFLSVSQNDHTGWCECDRCRRVEQEEGGAHSGPLLRFVNAVAEQIEKKHPHKLVDTLAYWYTERPPAKTRPRHNVRIRLCPIEACEAHPLGKCPYNRFFADVLRDWARIAGPMNVWHYNTNYSHYLVPFPDFHQLADSIRTYRRHGVTGMLMSGPPPPGGGGESSELRNYVAARMLWNTAVDVDREVNDFLAAVYGPAAPAMRRYFDLAHNQVKPPQRHMWIYDHPRVPYLSEDFLNRASAILEEAEKASPDDVVRRRVRRALLAIDYVRMKREQHFRVDGDSYEPPMLDRLHQRFGAFIAKARELGIQHLHEGQPIQDDVTMFEIGTRAWPAVTLEADGLRAVVSPPLSARVLEFSPRGGPNVLRVADSGAWRYPDVSGIWAQVHPDRATRVPYEFEWSGSGARTGASVTVAGRSDNGLLALRTIRIAGGRLETSTDVVNQGTSSIPVAIQARADYGPRDDLDGAGLGVRYRPVGGRAVDRRLFRPRGETSGVELLDGEDLPNGTWMARHRGKVPSLENLFDTAATSRCQLTWSLRGAPVVALSVWSPEVLLAPGQKLRLDSHYRIR